LIFSIPPVSRQGGYWSNPIQGGDLHFSGRREHADNLKAGGAVRQFLVAVAAFAAKLAPFQNSLLWLREKE
jgi:hypothetical protein